MCELMSEADLGGQLTGTVRLLLSQGVMYTGRDAEGRTEGTAKRGLVKDGQRLRERQEGV